MAALIPFNYTNHSPILNSGFDHLSNMLDDFFTDSFPMRRFNHDTFKLDVADNAESYDVIAELPGVAKEDVSLSFDEDRKLTISVKREEETNENGKIYLHRERRVSSMSRSIYLADADTADVKAKLENGILCINIPKIDKAAKIRSINID